MTEDWEFTQREAARSMLANYKLGIADSWIKAMTELITNSHQNYHDMIDDPEYTISEKPTIVIYANGVDETFTVLDHGTGIAGSGKELKELLDDRVPLVFGIILVLAMPLFVFFAVFKPF